AEGVENTETLELLKTMGCDIIQGYLLTAPRPLDEIERWLEAYEPGSIRNDYPHLRKVPVT
ncbi:MAG: EAL domain-containing protein, partial [Gammaproteobacteria bacterium]|nr:EAL domain-containing protein [Gammaproteobacteria bacterium]